MSHRLGSEGLGKQEARKKLRARKEQLQKLADDDNVIKHDQHHAANLLSRPSPATYTDHDTVITAVAHTQPPPQTPHLPSITYNSIPHQHIQATHCHITCTSSGCECNNVKHKYTTPCTPPPTIKPELNQHEGEDTR
jgi:hypothetical protein